MAGKKLKQITCLYSSNGILDDATFETFDTLKSQDAFDDFPEEAKVKARYIIGLISELNAILEKEE